MSNNFTKLSFTALMAIMASAVQAQLPTTPPELTWDPADVGVIYAADQDKYFEDLKDSQGNPASMWAPVVWGQQCVVSDDEAGDGAALRVDGFDFLPMQFKATMILNDYRYMHIDFWVSSDLPLDITLQNWWPGEKFITPIYQLKAGEWNSIEIDLDASDFTWSKKNEIPQHSVNVIKLGGEAAEAIQAPQGETIYMTNVICHNDASVTITPGIGGGGEEIVTGITNYRESVTNRRGDTVYNLQGQQVDAGYKGIVVTGGRKFVVH